MRVRLLGSVEADVDGEMIDIEHPARRTTLALLATAGTDHGPAAITTEWLVDAIYDGEPPATGRKSVQNHVAALRRQLGGAAIESVGGGYRLRIERNAIDLCEFLDEVADATSARRSGDVHRLDGLVNGARERWGEPFAGCRPCEFLDRTSVALGEAHDELRELTSEQHLRHGRNAAAIAELEALVADQPLRESAWALLVQALHADQRQADALAVYQRARSTLVKQLGVEPGRALRDAEAAVLAQRSTATGLPSYRTSLIGRKDLIERVQRAVVESQLVTLLGPGGVGKTRLAVEFARLSDDDVVFVDLAPVGPDGIGRALAASVGDWILTPTGEVATTALGRQPALVVMDNCEHVVDEVRHVLDEALAVRGPARFVATSRQRLLVDGELVVRVDPLPVDDAASLLRDRTTAAGGQITSQLSLDISRRLDGLPLALELAAHRCAQLPPALVAEELADRLELLSTSTGQPRQQSLRAIIEWSYELLGDTERLVLRRAAWLGGPFGHELLARACELSVVDTLGSLAALIDRSMVVVDGDRFRLLDTVSAAALLLSDAHEAMEVERRRLDWLLDELGDESDFLHGQTPYAHHVRREITHILAAVDHGLLHDRANQAATLASVALLTTGQRFDGVVHSLVRRVEQLLDETELEPDIRRRALCAHTMAVHAWRKPRPDLMVETVQRADVVDSYSALGLAFAGLAHAFDAIGRRPDADVTQGTQLLDHAVDIGQQVGGIAHSLPILLRGVVELNLGRFEAAARLTDSAESLLPPDRAFGPFQLAFHLAARWCAGRPVSIVEIDRHHEILLANEVPLIWHGASGHELSRLFMNCFSRESPRPVHHPNDIDWDSPAAFETACGSLAVQALDHAEPEFAAMVIAAHAEHGTDPGPAWVLPVLGEVARRGTERTDPDRWAMASLAGLGLDRNEVTAQLARWVAGRDRHAPTDPTRSTKPSHQDP